MKTKQWDVLWFNGPMATCEGGYGFVEKGAVAVKNGLIAWVGAMNELPGKPEELADKIEDVDGRLITPGLVDCHTHLVYAGNRAHEFEQRLNGVTYEQIASQGGGIQSTVSATRSATEDELFAESLPRAKALMASGVTTMEIKSGYGLDWETELKILRVAKRIEMTLPMTVCKTFLGAHTIPKEFKSDPEAYVDLVCQTMIPKVAKEYLAEAVDVFCEKIAFNIEQTERVFKTAKDHGLQIKCHAEQLSDLGASILAAKYGALSVDHLEHLTKQGIEAIEKSGTVAVLLPGAFYFLRETKLPPIALLRDHHIPIAIASDCNPGTSPIMSLLLILNMACTLFKMTPEEAFMGVTLYSAKALGLGGSLGSLTVGKKADLAIWNAAHPTELVYYMGSNPLYRLVKSTN